MARRYNTTQRSICHALAYVAITDSTRRLQRATWLVVTEFVTYDLDAHKSWEAHFYQVSPAGMELAILSPLWKAHRHLGEVGFVPLDRDGNASPNRVRYSHNTDPFRRAIVRRGGVVELYTYGQQDTVELLKFGHGIA